MSIFVNFADRGIEIMFDRKGDTPEFSARPRNEASRIWLSARSPSSKNEHGEQHFTVAATTVARLISELLSG